MFLKLREMCRVCFVSVTYKHTSALIFMQMLRFPPVRTVIYHQRRLGQLFKQAEDEMSFSTTPYFV